MIYMHTTGKKIVLTVLVISAIILLGLFSSMGISPGMEIFGGINIEQVIAAALVFCIVWLWKGNA